MPIFETMQNSSLAATIIASSLIAAAGGFLGAFALLRRMALVGDALSHVALPGIALGLLFHFNPFLGALAFLLFGTTIIWVVEHKTRLAVDTLVGVMFVMMLAFGALLTPEEEILEALFGNIAELSLQGALIASALALLMIGAIFILSKKLTLSMISRELALSSRLRPALLEFAYLTLFALMVAVGIQFTGILLMGALIIVPAAIARNLTASMRSYMTASALIGIAGALVSIFIALRYSLAPGPVFALILSGLFFISVALKRQP